LCGVALAQDAKTVIASAQAALGSGLTSITYSGSAKDVSFQQCGANAADMLCRGMHDPMRPITNYVRVIDLNAPLSRHTGGTNNIGAGGSTTVTPGTFFQQVTAQQANVSQPWAQQLELWITPWGFLKGAAANNATASRRRLSGKNYTVLSWSPTVKAPSGASYTINGWVNEDNLVERVETWLGENIMGDMHILATYTGWKDFGGVKAPAKIIQTRGGLPFFEVDVTAARMNPPDLATLAVPPAPAGRGGGAPPAGAPPAAAPGGRGGPGGAPAAAGAPGGARGGGVPPAPGGAPAAAQAGGARGGAAPAAPAPNPAPEKLGEGVWRTTGGYNSLVIEFKDYIMLLEAGGNQASAVAAIADARRLVPNKPIRYVMNTHPHSDHTAGLPAVVAEGATLLTHRNNADFFEKALNTPRTLLPADDALAKNPRRVRVEGIGDKKVYTDGTQVVEFYHTPGVPHTNGMLIAYLPKLKTLFQGDFSLPAAGQPGNDHVKALVPILEKLNLDFDRYINVHNSNAPQTKAELWKAVGK
jgi:glyoxylase-like metal-dependent hydrolase (beta-lactamase superfamily II)